jgi:hypothetical protein
MVATVTGCIVFGIAALVVLNATLGRYFGFHRASKWEGGGQLTLVAELSAGVLFAAVGAGLWHPSPIWLLFLLPALVVGLLSQRRANRTHREQQDQLRRRNAADHPGVFDRPPPTDIDAIEGEVLDLYDSGACTYLGTIAKSEMAAIVDACPTVPDQPFNDVFLISESLEMLPQTRLSPQTLDMLRAALQEREYLLLRWMPCSPR